MKKVFFILLINSASCFPLFIAIIFFFKNFRKKTDVFSTLIILELLLISYTSGIWYFLNIYLRYIHLILIFSILVLILIKILKHKISPVFSKTNLFIKTPFILLFLFILIVRIFSYFPRGEIIDLSFPLKNGNYLIIQGGSNFLTNPSHILQPGTDYAIDIIKLSSFGFAGKNVFFDNPEDIFIFGDTIYSPCNGLIIKTVDSIYDNKLFHLNRSHSTGNYIVLLNYEVKICIAHIKQNSIFVKEGNFVVSGEPIALVGNSGNSFYPHLHLHAIRGDSSTGVLDGEPVSMIFDNNFLSINSIIVSNKNTLLFLSF